MILIRRLEAVTATVTAMTVAVKSPKVPKVCLLIKVKKASKAAPLHNCLSLQKRRNTPVKRKRKRVRLKSRKILCLCCRKRFQCWMSLCLPRNQFEAEKIFCK